MTDDRFRASMLSVQTLELQREAALAAAQLSEDEFSKMDFNQADAVELLGSYPAGLAVSRFVNTDEALMLLKEVKSLDTVQFGMAASTLLKARLNERRRLLASFYLEFRRMAADDSPTFSDNLMLELTDFIMQAVPILITFVENKRLSTVAMLAANLAAEIRAQIVWGSVADWGLFRQDVLMLGHAIVEMDQTLGNNVADFSSLEKIDLENTPEEKDSFYAMQAILSYRKSLGI